MKGVATGVSPDLKLFDCTHKIPAYNIWEAAYCLEQMVMYWPAGTVFVSVIDPGVATNRKSVVLKTKSGHFIVTPDISFCFHYAAGSDKAIKICNNNFSNQFLYY